MTRCDRGRQRRNGHGFSLLEVLVSIAVLMLGLLGAAGMLLQAMRTTTESGNFTAAVNFSREFSEKVRTNKTVAVSTDAAKNKYLLRRNPGDATPASTGKNCSSIACEPQELAAWDAREWVARIDKALPGAKVAVCFDNAALKADGSYDWECSNAGILVVKIGWTPRDNSRAEQSTIDKGADLAPRIVFPLAPGQSYAGTSPPS
ncbi:type IV pilus assembly protein PilV [Variovorax sp. 770b2]|nr:type IV pilus assembly protein PilV [Variovorax sp. 770b2]